MDKYFIVYSFDYEGAMMTTCTETFVTEFDDEKSYKDGIKNIKKEGGE